MSRVFYDSAGCLPVFSRASQEGPSLRRVTSGASSAALARQAWAPKRTRCGCHSSTTSMEETLGLKAKDQECVLLAPAPRHRVSV